MDIRDFLKKCTALAGGVALAGMLNAGVPTSDHNLRDCHHHQDYIKKSTLVDFELYNISKDIGQNNNLATSQPKRFNAMKKKMIQLHEEIITEGHTWSGLPACSS